MKRFHRKVQLISVRIPDGPGKPVPILGSNSTHRIEDQLLRNIL